MATRKPTTLTPKLLAYRSSIKDRSIALVEDLTGRRFGRLTAIRMDRTGRRVFWICRCDCGNEHRVQAANLKSCIKSCGCLRRDIGLKQNRTHGHTLGYEPSPEYRTWCAMKARCYNRNNPNFKQYGGRGIVMCDSWFDFDAFLRDMGSRPPGTSIDRIDNNGPYSPSNCRWATPSEQARNQSHHPRITWRGETRLLVEWCELLHLKPATVYWRRTHGRTLDEVFAPVKRCQ